MIFLRPPSSFLWILLGPAWLRLFCGRSGSGCFWCLWIEYFFCCCVSAFVSLGACVSSSCCGVLGARQRSHLCGAVSLNSGGLLRVSAIWGSILRSCCCGVSSFPSCLEAGGVFAATCTYLLQVVVTVRCDGVGGLACMADDDGAIVFSTSFFLSIMTFPKAFSTLALSCSRLSIFRFTSSFISLSLL